MKKICIATNSVTYAQKGKAILDRSGIPSTPLKRNGTAGCGWCLAVEISQKNKAIAVLRENGVKISGEIYDLS